MLWVNTLQYVKYIINVFISSRWDTHGHPLADFHGDDPDSELFPGELIKI
jgi:hypothetical protein